MANVDKAFGYRFVRSGSGDCAPPMEKAKLAASTDIAVGDPIRMDTDGLLDPATGSQAPLGFAAEAITGAAGVTPDLLYHLARRGDKWRAQFESGTTVAQTNIGDTVGSSGSSGAYELTATTSGPFAIAELWDDPNNALGEHAVMVVSVMNPQHYDAVG